MKYAIMSDVHSNPGALETALTDANGVRYAEALNDGNDDMDAPPLDATTVTLDKVFKKA